MCAIQTISVPEVQPAAAQDSGDGAVSPICNTAVIVSDVAESRLLLPQQPVSQSDGDSLIDSVNTVLVKKKEKKQEALDETWARYSPSMIGGDVLTMAYTFFSGLQSFIPALQTISCIGWITSGAGEIGGLINIMVACREIKEALAAQGNDRVTFWKNMLDATLYILIGLLMIMIGISSKVIALGGLSAFFTANPWLLPVLFFAASIPLIIDTSYRVTIIVSKTDLTSCISVQAIKTHLVENQKERALTQLTKISLFQDLLNKHSLMETSQTMEALQADMGVEAAIEVFTLFQELIDPSKNATEILDQVKMVEQRIAEWHRAQYVRFFQQVLYILAFVISMGAFAPGVNANKINGSDNMAMAAANLIPLYMDVFWPFKRNIQMVVYPAIKPAE